jgi:DNA-binding IclR family transcriptional regulator
VTDEHAADDPAQTSAGAPAVRRAIRVLQTLGASGGVPQTLTDLSRALGIAKSSALAICTALEEGGMVRRTDLGYTLGRETLELGGSYLRTFEPVREFYRVCTTSPVLNRELCQVAVLDGTDVIYLGTHAGRAPFRLSATVGARYPASITAVGNALLAELPAAEVAERFREPATRPAYTASSVTALDALQAKLERVRERGYAVDEGEVYPGVVGIAMTVPPVVSGEQPFAVGASLLETGTSDDHFGAVVAALREAVAELGNPMNAATTDRR